MQSIKVSPNWPHVDDCTKGPPVPPPPTEPSSLNKLQFVFKAISGLLAEYIKGTKLCKFWNLSEIENIEPLLSVYWHIRKHTFNSSESLAKTTERLWDSGLVQHCPDCQTTPPNFHKTPISYLLPYLIFQITAPPRLHKKYRTLEDRKKSWKSRCQNGEWKVLFAVERLRDKY